MKKKMDVEDKMYLLLKGGISIELTAEEAERLGKELLDGEAMFFNVKGERFNKFEARGIFSYNTYIKSDYSTENEKRFAGYK
jgi:hypothetical protein